MRSKLKKALFIILALLSASFVLSSPGKVRAAPIAHLQSTLANTSALVTSLSATFASAVGNGDLVVVATSSWNTGNTASITSVTDSKGNTYTKVLENGAGAVEPLSIWYAQNVVGGSGFTVSAATNSNASMTIAIHEYSGVDTLAALDSSANTSATGTSASSGNTTTHVSGELLFGAFNFSDDTSSVSGVAGNGFTLRQQLTDNHTYEAIFTEDSVVSSAGLYPATLAYSQSVTWRGAVVAFKPKSVPTPTPTLPATPTSSPTSTPTSSPTATGTLRPSPTPSITASPTSTPTSSPTATATPRPSPTPSVTASATSTPVASPTPTPTSQSIQPEYFKIGPGYADVIPHQLIRTSTDTVYLFAATGVNSSTIQVYWTNNPGIPSSQASFTGSLTFNTPANPISIDAVYDGGSTVHVLANLTNGLLYDYVFDLPSHTFKTPKLISSGNPVRPSLYQGTVGVSGMMSLDGTLNIAYWSNGNHITYVSYIYDKTSDTLTLKEGPTQLDAAGSASHPVLAVSPADGSITVAWISEATTPPHILAKTKSASTWGNIEMVSNAAVNVFTKLDPYGGLNVDQGPSLMDTLDGKKHLTYIEGTDSTGSYGHLHYVVYTGQTGWVDSTLNYYTHNPALATDNNSDVYLFGHGMYLDSAPCTSNAAYCLLKQNANGTWGAPQLFATPPNGETFDASVSTKWSIVGWNRPELIEFAFFSGQTSNYWNMSLYYGTLGGSTTSPTSTPTPGPTPTSTSSPTPTRTVTPAPTPTLGPTPTSTSSPTATPTVTASPTPTLGPTPTSTKSPTPTPTVTASPTPAPAAIAYVQSNLSNNGSLVSSTTTQFTNPVTTGDLVVVAVSSWNSSTSQVSSVTDNKGNAYTRVVDVAGAANEPLSIWYAKNVVGGSSFAVTVNVSTASSLTTAIHEYHGLSGTAPLDLYADQTGSGTSASSGLTGVTTSSSELIFGAFNYDDAYTSNALTPAAGFTSRQSLQDNNNYEALYTIDKVVNSASQYSAAGTFGTTCSWRAVVVTFK